MMLPLIENTILILLACMLSSIVTILLLRKNNAEAGEILNYRLGGLAQGIQDEIQALLDSTFAEYKPLISRSMTLAANAGAQAKKVQAFEREAMRAIQDDLPITPEMISAFSPKLGEMVEENPELLLKGREILQRILGDNQQGFNGSRRARIDRRAEI